jgi:outer membrane protein assembly factor BamB
MTPIFVCLLLPVQDTAGDWPQFMRTAEHRGDAAGETLALPLGLEARVALDDAVLSSPAVVGGRADGQGETAAIDAASGRVLWRSTEAHCGYRGTPSTRDGRVYPSGWDLPLACVSAADGTVVWRTGQRMHWGHVPALGPDCFAGRGCSGRAEARSLEVGKAKKADGKQILLGGPDHACGPVALTSGGASLAVTVSGLYVRDAATGKPVWGSPGFAPRSCSSPIAASGRVFYNPQANGMLYCWEPAR